MTRSRLSSLLPDRVRAAARPVVGPAVRRLLREAQWLSVGVDETSLVGEWTSTRPSGVRYAVEEREHRITHEGPGVYVRRNELWRVETDEATGQTTERLLVENEGLLLYEPFLPAGGQGVGRQEPEALHAPDVRAERA